MFSQEFSQRYIYKYKNYKSDFYEQFIPANPIHYFVRHLIKLENYECISAQKEIVFNRLAFGTKRTSFLMNMGKPRYRMEYKNLPFDLKALMYKSKLLKKKGYEIYCFLNDEFFYGEFVVANVSTDDAAIIRKVIVEKYCSAFPQTEKFYIADKNKSIVYLIDETYLRIRYMSMKSEYAGKLLNAYNKEKRNVKLKSISGVSDLHKRL
ncbi:MAG: hypothetical protein COA57_12105 [Flavobacteriales bacterium]|nr:MAG: hypothetical protein COA57_12105 [Flavobacteriales bacterium]